MQRETIPPESGAIPADWLLESAIRAMVMCDQATLHSLEALASQVTAPERWERYLTLRSVYRGLLEETARNLRMIRHATGRAAMSGVVQYGIPSAMKHGGPSHGNPDHRL